MFQLYSYKWVFLWNMRLLNEMVGAVQKCTPQNYTLKYGGIPIFWVIAGVCSAEQSQKKGHKIKPVQWL